MYNSITKCTRPPKSKHTVRYAKNFAPVAVNFSSKMEKYVCKIYIFCEFNDARAHTSSVRQMKNILVKSDVRLPNDVNQFRILPFVICSVCQWVTGCLCRRCTTCVWAELAPAIETGLHWNGRSRVFPAQHLITFATHAVWTFLWARLFFFFVSNII